MRVEVNDLVLFSMCPRYYGFSSREKPSKDRRFDIFKDIVLKCMQKKSSGHKAIWRNIVGWIDKEVFKDINVLDKQEYEKGRKLAESVLLPVQNWYQNYYEHHKSKSITSIPLEVNVNNHVVCDTIDIISEGNPVVLTQINQIDLSKKEMYNNTYLRILAWMLGKTLETTSIEVENITLGTVTSVKSKSVLIMHEPLFRIEKIVEDILVGIQKKVNYPSITSMCNKCKFNERCVL